MRRILSLVLAVAVVPAIAVIAPTVTLPKPTPHPVAPQVSTIALQGVTAAVTSPAAASLASADSSSVVGPAPLVLTAPQMGKHFSMVGITWPRTAKVADLTFWVRTHGSTGWSGWTQLDPTDTTPNAATPEARKGRLGTDPVYTGEQDGVQVRINGPAGTLPAGLRLELIDPGTSPADANIGAHQAGAAHAVANQPTIISRAQWGADESLRNGPPWYSDTIKVAFIHHTVTTNNYTPDQAAQYVRAIYAYDTVGLGWSDIAYNFLVDKYGNIYEGRWGGITKAVYPAATGGFNNQTVAVAALGCFDTSCSSGFGGPAQPTSAMINSIAEIVGWKLGLFYRNPLGTYPLTSGGFYGSNVAYPAGQVVQVAAVSGHRDVNATACPGNLLYPYVHTTIAELAAQYQGQMMYDPQVSATTATWGATNFNVTATVAPQVTPGAATTGTSSTASSTSTATATPTATSSATSPPPPVFSPATLSPVSQPWTLTVTAPGASTPIRTMTGTATSSSPINAAWDGRTDSGALAPPGVYQLTLSSAVSWSTYVEIDAAPGAPAAKVGRLGGADRYSTAVSMAQAAYPTSKSVVLVSGDTAHIVDGLVAAPLARTIGGPILLTSAASLPTATADEITRRHATTAYLVGGTASISDTVATQLKSLGVTTVTRIAGADRYATAAEVAKEMATLRAAANKPPITSVMIASGDDTHLIDATTASGPASATGRPILLAAADTLPAPTAAELSALKPTSSFVLGTSAVISDAVAAQLPAPTRLGGADRYATAVAVANQFASQVGLAHIDVASGANANLIDSLAGGALGRITLLTAPDSLSSATDSWLASTQGSASKVAAASLLGGTGATSTLVYWQVATRVAG